MTLSKNQLIIFIILILGSGCSKGDDFPLAKDEYAVVVTKEPSNINNEGVTLSGKLISKGPWEIKKYGFIIDKGFGYSPFRVNFQGEPERENFFFRLSSDMEKGGNYTYWAFVETEYEILGNKLNFESKGSKSPVIIDFFPKNGIVGDTVTLIGDYFSYVPSRNIVLIGKKEVYKYYSSNDSIVFRMPQIYNTGPVEISIKVGSKQEVVAGEEFNVTGWPKRF